MRPEKIPEQEINKRQHNCIFLGKKRQHKSEKVKNKMKCFPRFKITKQLDTGNKSEEAEQRIISSRYPGNGVHIHRVQGENDSANERTRFRKMKLPQKTEK